MPKSKEKPSTGFRKGFLLASSKRVKKKQARAVVNSESSEEKKASSVLLHVEEEKNPLLFVGDDVETSTDATTSIVENKPLHVLITERDDNDKDSATGDGFGLTAVSTRRKSPLITEVSTKDDRIMEMSKATPASVEQPKKDEKVLLLSEVPAPSEAPSLPTIEADEDTDTSTVPHSLLVTDDHSVGSDGPTEPNTQLSHELPNLLWKLKQRSNQEEQAIVEQFVTNQVHCDEDWKIVWAFVLNDVAKDASSSRTSPSIQLGLSLLDTTDGLESFVPFLDANDDKQSRLLALGGAILIHRFCDSVRESNGALSHVAWLTQVVPCLSKIVMASPTKRSVLSQQYITCVYDIVALACSQKDGIARLNLESNLWDALSTTNDLLLVQQCWIEHSSKEKQSDTYASRRKCTLAVIHDWRLIIKEALRLYEGIEMNGCDGAALANLTEYTCLQLAGETTTPDGLGGLYQTLSNDPPKQSVDAIVESLQTGTQLVQSIREKQECQEMQSWQRKRVRAIVRGTAAWLGQSKKHLQALTKPSVDDGTASTSIYLQQITDLCIQLLRCDSEDAVNLVVTILSYLWSSSNGLPPDFIVDDASGSATSLPASFELLLDELRTESVTDSGLIDPTKRALCTLVSRCIQCRGTSLLEELVKRNGTQQSTVEVLGLVLSEAKTAAPMNGSLGSDHESLLTRAGDIFLSCIATNQYAQRMLTVSPGLLCVLPAKTVVSRLVAIVNEKISNTNLTAVVATALTQIVVANLPNGAEETIQTLLESLASCDDGQEQPSSDTPRSTRLVRKLASPWRQVLLESPSCDVGGFADVLSAVAHGMFADPSSSVPLALLGTLVGDRVSPTVNIDGVQAPRIHVAVATVVKQSLAELDRADGMQDDEKGGIYARLSPLLLLRRIPHGYYLVAWKVVIDDRGEMCRLFSQLADQLSFRMGNSPSSASDRRVAFAPEERRLASEIAGRCLPFDEDEYPSCSCYQHICLPSFSSALSGLPFTNELELSGTRDLLRTARTALYACCHHVPIAQDSESGQCIYGIFSFVSVVLGMDVACANGSEGGNEEGIVQLQTGCIEFVAVCLESTLQRHLRGQKANQSEAILEIDMPSANLNGVGSREAQSVVNTKQALGASSSSVASLLRTDSTIPSQLLPGNNGYISESTKNASRELSVPARTCLWNAFLVVSQRCPDDGQLSTWANLTAPWVLEWASLGPINDNLRHPLCMAAALQVIFVLITRTKSFFCLVGGGASGNDYAIGVRKAYKVAIASINTETSIGGDYARITMRKAGMKLLLSLVTLDQTDDGASLSSCLSPGELGETFTLLNGTANVDPDSEVRMLASHILAGMRVS